MCDEKKQEVVSEYFIFGRKLGITSVYISQSYFKIPKTTRLQFSNLMLLKLSSMRDLNMVMAKSKNKKKDKDKDKGHAKAIHWLHLSSSHIQSIRRYGCGTGWYTYLPISTFTKPVALLSSALVNSVENLMYTYVRVYEFYV